MQGANRTGEHRLSETDSQRGDAVKRLLSTVGLCAVLLGAGCGGSSEPSEEEQVTQTVERYHSALASGEGQRACDQLAASARRDVAHFATEAFRDRGSVKCSRVFEQVFELADEDLLAQLGRLRVKKVKVRGDSATASVVGGRRPVRLRKIQGRWRIAVLDLDSATSPEGKAAATASPTESREETNTAPTPQDKARVLDRVVLSPVASEQPQAVGVAVLAERGGQKQLVTQAELDPSKGLQAYEVWLYNSPSDVKSLGAQVTDRKGKFQGAGPLPTDASKYRYIDISVENVDQNEAHSGRSVLRGKLP